MADYKTSYEKTMKAEGGYVNDPKDLGGETYKGISRRFHPNWDGWKVVDTWRHDPSFPECFENNACRSLEDRVFSFYKAHFWDVFLGDELESQELADELFDTGINMNPVRVIGFLQTSLNVMNRNGFLYPDIEPDGIFGRATLRSLELYCKNDDAFILVKIINILQGAYYIERMKTNETQERFARGWLDRVNLTKSNK